MLQRWDKPEDYLPSLIASLPRESLGKTISFGKLSPLSFWTIYVKETSQVSYQTVYHSEHVESWKTYMAYFLPKCDLLCNQVWEVAKSMYVKLSREYRVVSIVTNMFKSPIYIIHILQESVY